MDNRTEISRNQTALNYQLVWFSLVYLILGSLSIVILLIPFNFMDSGFIIWALIIMCLAIAFYILSIWMLKKTWYSIKYYLTKDCIVIKKGFNSTREDIYRYDTINSVSIKQKAVEKQRNYGKILIKVPDQPSLVVLKDISMPSETATTIQNNIVDASRKNYSV